MADCGCGACSTKAVVITASTLVVVGCMLKDLFKLKTYHVVIGGIVSAVAAVSVYKLIDYMNAEEVNFHMQEDFVGSEGIPEIGCTHDQDLTW
jgi:uncharacterized membrane protein